MQKKIDSVTVFGVNPDTNPKKDELKQRLDKLKEVLLTSSPKTVVFLGGESWSSNGQTYTESGLISSVAKQELSQILPDDVVELPYGLETMSQTHALLDYMETSQTDPSQMGIVTTWHQLLRSGAVFWSQGYKLPTMFPIFQAESVRDVVYDITINAFAGVGYTLLSEMLQKNGIWTDGGPLVNKINEERTTRDKFSWFNTTK